MVITVDTSALLAVLLNEQHKPAIIEATKGHDLQAPASLDAEVGNALSAMFKRGRLSLKEARQVLAQFVEIPIRRTELRMDEAIMIAHKYGIYAYDAYVLYSSIQYQSKLLSLDSHLIVTTKKMNVDLLGVTQ